MQLLDHVAEEALRRGEVEQHVALGAAAALGVLELDGEALERGEVVEVARVVGHLAAQPVPRLVVELATTVADEALERGRQALLPGVIGHLAVIETDHGEVVGQQAGAAHVVQRGHHEAAGEVTGGAENHDGTRVGRMSAGGGALRLGLAHARTPWGSRASGVAWTSAVALYPCARLKAALINATWEKACGKLPSSRFDRGSYSSASSPRSFARPIRRVNKSRPSSKSTQQHIVLDQPEAAWQELAFTRGQAIHATARVVTAHEALHEQVFLDRTHGRDDARIVRRKKIGQRHQQQARVQFRRPVRLGEAATHRVNALGQDVGLDLVGDGAPPPREALVPRPSPVLFRRRAGTPAMPSTFECTKWRGSPRISQMPSSGERQMPAR